MAPPPAYEYQANGKHGIVCRHVDSAQWYQNEKEVGKAVRQSGVKREDIFVSEYI